MDGQTKLSPADRHADLEDLREAMTARDALPRYNAAWQQAVIDEELLIARIRNWSGPASTASTA